MFSTLAKNKINVIIASLFIVIALVYSEMIVLDEEALVASCFIMFVLFAYQVVGGMISAELDERSSRIASELQKSLESKKENLLASIEYLQKQENLTKEIQDLYNYTVYQIKTISYQRRSYLETKINSLVTQQLKLVSSKEKEILYSIQNDVISSFCNSIVNEFKNASSQEARAQLLEESIAAIGLLPTNVLDANSN